VLDVLFWGLKASPIAWAYGNCNFWSKKDRKKFLLYFFVQFLVIKIPDPDLKCWIRIRIRIRNHSSGRNQSTFFKEHNTPGTELNWSTVPVLTLRTELNCLLLLRCEAEFADWDSPSSNRGFTLKGLSMNPVSMFAAIRALAVSANSTRALPPFFSLTTTPVTGPYFVNIRSSASLKGKRRGINSVYGIISWDSIKWE
jgi:hypothetical protein